MDPYAMTGDQLMGYANCFQLYAAAVEQGKWLEKHSKDVEPALFGAHATYLDSLERMMVAFASAPQVPVPVSPIVKA